MSLENPAIPLFHSLPNPVKGAILMTLAALGFSVMNVAIREVTAEIDPLQAAFFRNVFAAAFMLPWMLKARATALQSANIKLHFARAGIGILAMICWFTSIAKLPLAEAVALNFTVPLFATIGAAVFLGEIVRARRWTATTVGFLGMLVILRPGFQEITFTMLLPVIAAVLMAGSVILVKLISRTDGVATTVLYMNLLLTVISFPPALLVWQWPSLTTLGLSVVIGGVAVLAHLCLVGSYKFSDASAVIPYDYMRLPFIAVFAYLLYGETPDFWTWVGAAIIIGSTLYIARREAQVAKVKAASAAPAARDL